MPRDRPALLAFNRGLVSRLALARTDLARMALSASIMVNWMPRVLGSMMLRPGWGYIDSTNQNQQAKHIPFIKATDDTALIELTDGALRVRVDEAVVTRPSVATTIRGGDFSADVTHWNKQTNPVSLPQGDGECVAWSPDGQLLAVGNATTAFLRVYSVSGSTFTALSFPSSALPGQVNGVAFSSDGLFLGIAFAASPFFRVYAVTGTGASATFTALSDPVTAPTGNGNGIAFSITAGQVAVAHATSPFVSIYTVTGSGASATLAKVADPGTLPASTGRGVSYSGDGQFLAVAHDTTPFVTIYSMSSTTYTKLANPVALPAAAGFGIAFSRSVAYLAVAHTTTPFVTVYSISGTTFTKLTNPISLPAGNGKGVGFSTDNQYLSVAHTTTPFVTNYALSGSGSSTVLTKESDPGTLPAGQGNGAKFSPDNHWLAVAHTTTPFVTIYEAYQWLDLDGSGAASTYGGSSGSGATVGPVTLGASCYNGTNQAIRNVINAAQVLMSGTAVQIQFQAAAASTVTVTKCYIGTAASAGSASFASTPTAVTFSSGAAGFTISNSGTITSDTIAFNLDASSDLVISFYIPGQASGMAAAVTLSGWSNFSHTGDLASSVSGAAYSDSTGVRNAVGVTAVNVIGSGTPGNYLSLVGTGYTAAKRVEGVVVSAANKATEHGLSIVIARGRVTLRVGTSFGLDDLIAEVALTEGYHSLSFTPNANIFFVEVSSITLYATLLDSVTIEAAAAMVLPTPWTASNLQYIRPAQSADVVFVACLGVQPQRIERRTTRSWSVVKYLPEDGPYRLENVDSLITMAPSALTGDITITASRSFFTAANVGSLFRITSIGQTVAISVTAQNQFSDPIKVTGVGDDRLFSITISGTFSATLTVQRSLTEPGAWTDVSNPTFSTDLTDGLDNQVVYYRIGVKTGDYVSGTAVLNLSYASGGLAGVARITAYTSTTLVSAIVLHAFGGTTASEDWAEGLWSDRRGWPSAAALDEGRLWFAGKDKITGSESDAYDSFDPSTEGDSGPINRTIGEGPVDTINWLLPGQRLILGGQGSEISARSSSFDEPLTPTQFALKSVSTQGSAPLPIVRVDTSGIYVQRSGTRVFQLGYNANIYDYASAHLSSLIPEIGEPSIVAIAVQRNPDTRIHCARSDGTVAVLLFDENEDVRCWLELETSGVVEDVTVLPGALGSPEDKVYYTVNRTINGATVRYLEKWALESECVGGTLNKQADAFISFTQASSATVTGLSALEGATVVCWANGKCMRATDGTVKTFTVASGQITLTNNGAPFLATSGIVGLSYTAQFQSTKLAYAAGGNGTSLVQRKKLRALGLVAADMHARGVRYGGSFTSLRGLPEKEQGKNVDPDYIWTDYDEPMFSLDGTWDSDSRLCLQAEAPRPVTLLAAIIDIETTA